MPAGEPMDPQRQIEVKKRYGKGKQEALQKDPEIGIPLVLDVCLLYPVAPPRKDRKRTEFKLRIFVVRARIGMVLVQTVKLIVLDRRNLTLFVTHMV